MEGLIPFLLHAMKKQRPQNVYRCLSENSTTGRSYHLLLAGDSKEGSSHRRTRSDFRPPSTVDFSTGSEHLAHINNFTAKGPTDNGLRQRALNSATQYQVSGGTNKYGKAYRMVIR